MKTTLTYKTSDLTPSLLPADYVTSSQWLPAFINS